MPFHHRYRRNSDQEIRSLERRFLAGERDVEPQLRAAYERGGISTQSTDVRLSYVDQQLLESAIDIDHPCSDDNSCDIAAALNNGFVEVAAHLLLGATECETVDTIIEDEELDLYGSNIFGRYPWPRGWDEWVKWHEENGYQCEDCGAYNFADGDDICGNCHAPIVRDNDEDEDDEEEEDEEDDDISYRRNPDEDVERLRRAAREDPSLQGKLERVELRTGLKVRTSCGCNEIVSFDEVGACATCQEPVCTMCWHTCAKCSNIVCDKHNTICHSCENGYCGPPEGECFDAIHCNECSTWSCGNCKVQCDRCKFDFCEKECYARHECDEDQSSTLNARRLNPTPDHVFSNWHVGGDILDDNYILYALTPEGQQELQRGLVNWPLPEWILGEVKYNVPKDDNYVYINWIGVREGLRRQKLGSALWAEMRRLYPGYIFPARGLTDQGIALRKAVGMPLRKLKRYRRNADESLRRLQRDSLDDPNAEKRFLYQRIRAGQPLPIEEWYHQNVEPLGIHEEDFKMIVTLLVRGFYWVDNEVLGPRDWAWLTKPTGNEELAYLLGVRGATRGADSGKVLDNQITLGITLFGAAEGLPALGLGDLQLWLALGAQLPAYHPRNAWRILQHYGSPGNEGPEIPTYNYESFEKGWGLPTPLTFGARMGHGCEVHGPTPCHADVPTHKMYQWARTPDPDRAIFSIFEARLYLGIDTETGIPES